MKIAISLPDDLSESADAAADRMGISRSELYVRAVAEYLARHRDQDVTARLDAVYAQEPSGVEPRLRKAQARSARGTGW